MLCLLVYDIPHDGLRSKVADICLDYGLERIQYSAFMGELSPNRQEEIVLKIRRRTGRRAADVRLFPICERDARCIRVFRSDGSTSANGEPSSRRPRPAEGD